MKRCLVLPTLFALWPALMTSATEWPQFRGPERDGTSAETGLLKTWPEGGPKLLWSANGLGDGWSSVAVAGGTIYTTGMFDEDGYVTALDLDGQPKWKTKYGPEWTRNFKGARSTPTVEGDRLYVMSGAGAVACCSTGDGKTVWTVDTKERFGARDIRWGQAESVLLVGDLVICTPGGEKVTVAALDKGTGKTVWTCSVADDKAGYCSPIHVSDGPRDLIVTVTSAHIVGIAPRDGALLWKHPYENQWQAHPNSPMYYEGGIYVTSGYDAEGVMLRLSPDGGSVKRAWTDTTLDTHHGGVVAVDGFIYGSSWKGNSDGRWVCLDWATGKVRYETQWENKGPILYADGMLYCYTEKSGMVGLATATPDRFEIEGSFEVTQGDGQHWAHPSIADGRLYVRHGDVLMAYDVRGQ